jgi:hypothetical protein
MVIGIFPENFRKKSGPEEPLRERRIEMKKFTLLPSFFIGLKSKDFKKSLGGSARRAAHQSGW